MRGRGGRAEGGGRLSMVLQDKELGLNVTQKTGSNTELHSLKSCSQQKIILIILRLVFRRKVYQIQGGGGKG